MYHVLAVLCFAGAWCCASIANHSAGVAIRDGHAWALGWMAAGAVGGTGLVLIGLELWG